MSRPTQAQIEAAGIEAVKDELDFQRSKGSIKAAGLEWVLSRLTAAAEVEPMASLADEKLVNSLNARTAAAEAGPVTCLDIKMATESAVAATIERCAQVAEHWKHGASTESKGITAAIRAIKDQP